MTKVYNIAHRGASAYQPENTMSAFQAAMAMDAHMIELDVRCSADGDLVVIHDETVNRTSTGKGRVCQLTLAQLKQLDMGPGEKISTLQETLAWAQDKIALNVEIKEPGVETQVAELLEAYMMTDRVIVSSFHVQILERLKAINPHIALALLFSSRYNRALETARDLSIPILHPHYLLVTPRQVNKAHAQGLQVNAWTVDEAQDMLMLMQSGVDGIITNRPDLLADLLQNQTRPPRFR